MFRWDISALDQLPADYLKFLYGALLNVYDEVDRMVSMDGRCYSMSFTKDEVIILSYPPPSYTIIDSFIYIDEKHIS